MDLKNISEDLFKITTAKVLLLIVGSIGTYAYVDKQSAKVEVAEESEAQEDSATKTKKARAPSSIKKPETKNTPTYKPVAKITNYEGSNFLEPESANTPEQGGGGYLENSPVSTTARTSTYQSMFSSTPTYFPNGNQGTGNERLAASIPSAPEGQSSSSGAGSVLVSGNKDRATNNPVQAASSSTSTSSGSSPAASIENSCSSNTLGGTFGNPIAITLNCAFPSTIKYCLSSTGTCCDPASAGVLYGTKVVIGPKNGNYCLSYFGDSDSEGSSIVYEQNYTINSTLPNLSVGQTKLFYQTTELVGASFINSLDFGKPNFSVGQINLKTNNLDCNEILANDFSLLAPAPVEILPLFDVSLASIASQVQIPLRPDQLDYGDNFVISYIKNNNFAAPLYSCSTAKINLDDFEYFQSDSAQSEPGDNSMRTFEGQFSSYEVISEENSGETLKSGMLAILY